MANLYCFAVLLAAFSANSLPVGATATCCERSLQEPDPDSLWDAARAGDLQGLKKALDAGVDVNSKTAYGSTAISFACDRGHVDIVWELLQRGADPNIEDSFYKATPMTWAVSGNHYEIIRILLAAGVEGADSMFLSAVDRGQEDLAKAVSDSGKVSPLTALFAKRIARAKGEEKFEGLFESLTIEDVPEWNPATDLAKSVAGKYVDESGERSISIEENEGKLRLVLPSTQLPMIPLVENEFWAGIARLAVVTNDPVEIHLITDDETIVYKRTGDVESSPQALDSDSSEAKGEMASDESLVAEPFTASPADLAVSSVNWPGFRGMGSRGVADGQNPPVEWDQPSGKNLLWKTDIPGLGMSSPSIWGDYLFVTSAVSTEGDTDVRIGLYGDVDSVEDDSEYDFNLYCLNKHTGEIVWQDTVHTGKPAVKRHSKSSHANPTVALDGEHVVSFFGSEGLYCHDMKGNLLWKTGFGLLDSGWFLDPGYQWGFGSSPVIHEGCVIVQCDRQKDSFISSIDLNTGSEKWKTPRAEIPTWSSPIVYCFGDLPMVVTHGTRAARGYDARSGAELWSLAGHSEIVVPTPFVAHDLIFIASGYSPVQPIVAIKPELRGSFDVPGRRLEDGTNAPENPGGIAWSMQKGGPYMPTPIAYGDYLYTCSNNGIVTCYEAKTGTQVYKKRLKGGGTMAFTSSPLAADGHLYLTAEDGRVFVVAAGRNFVQTATNPMGESTLATPAISEGTFYGRTVRGIVAFRDMETADGEDDRRDTESQSGDRANQIVVECFLATHEGYSVDEVLLDDALQKTFLSECSSRLPELSAERCNWLLINLRKAGKMSGIDTTKRRNSDTSEVRALAEVVARQIQDRYSVSIDQVMASPEKRSEFDSLTMAIDPAADLYLVRKAAFQLRKTRQLKPELITRIADWGRVVTSRSVTEWRDDLPSIPDSPGIYLFSDASGYLYVGEAENLRKRLTMHLDRSDRKSLAEYLAEQGAENTIIEIHTFEAGSRIEEHAVRRAYESELIRSRNPRFNIRP